MPDSRAAAASTGPVASPAASRPGTEVAPEGETRTAPLRQVLLHLVTHSTYHRGQVAAQLRQLGHAAPPTDLLDWRGSA